MAILQAWARVDVNAEMSKALCSCSQEPVSQCMGTVHGS